MLQQLDLHNFKAFQRFTIHLQGYGFLVGPNSAGKSTIVSALRLCGRMLRHASSKSATGMRNDQGRHVWAYSFGLDQFDFVSENIRHDFREIETRIDLRFKDVGVLRAVWPADEDNGIIEPFFYLENSRGLQLRRPKDVAAEFPGIGMIPLLSPSEVPDEMTEILWRVERALLDGTEAGRDGAVSNR